MRVQRRCLLLLMFLAAPGTSPAQSLLDRPPNISGNWAGVPGTLYFHFLHRFASSNAPERKVSNVPTFLVASALPKSVLAGLHYSSNSSLSIRYPNEWELFGRWLPFAQDNGAPFDVGAQAGYNNAADGVDGEVSLARRTGRLRVVAVGRALTGLTDERSRRMAFGAGATLRLGTYAALAGDVATLADRSPNERVAWSAGLHVAIPLTPHTVSLQATNTLVTTMQGNSRGSADIRYGFEFTVPLTLRRYFGSRTVSEPAVARADSGTLRTGMRNSAFTHRRIEIVAGTKVQWTNNDAMPHTVTAVDNTFDSGLIAAGKVWEHTFTTPGTYEFYCMPHPFMKGVIVVRAR